MIVSSHKKAYFFLLLLIIIFMGVLLFFFMRFRDSSKNAAEGNNVLDISQEQLLSKYNFALEREMGARQSPNFKTKVDLWGVFEKTDGNMFYIKIFDDLVALPLPQNNSVFKGARDPKDSSYIDIAQLQKGTGIVVTLNQVEKPYKVEMIQIPFH